MLIYAYVYMCPYEYIIHTHSKSNYFECKWKHVKNMQQHSTFTLSSRQMPEKNELDGEKSTG